MAWHSVTQSQTLTGKSRRTLYRDMAKGRLSWQTNANGHREIETTELIRVYGELVKSGTAEWPRETQSDGTQYQSELLTEIRTLRQEIADLKTTVLRLEYKPIPTRDLKDKKWWQWRRS
ncbi:entry exclusion protein 1 [Xenorhabdus bovienii]|uniref:entry exclusion protein 1 n=1 Tax=Xenorhabdus bovienii TaxID=40576 RepID=UPI0023B327E3|nr:entry exclusion protein 1 [Xenorhabdus bovienii]MDE9459686.1 entry exclusion protein 1 [Xenorhabdus bovienii]MDE9488034.1 entry exclusion protein 1 [Xenorhabdus bovienii]MDE9516005.1 entry exclusion protein 1 [Xenorhabdus bovienii]